MSDFAYALQRLGALVPAEHAVETEAAIRGGLARSQGLSDAVVRTDRDSPVRPQLRAALGRDRTRPAGHPA